MDAHPLGTCACCTTVDWCGLRPKQKHGKDTVPADDRLHAYLSRLVNAQDPFLHGSIFFFFLFAQGPCQGAFRVKRINIIDPWMLVLTGPRDGYWNHNLGRKLVFRMPSPDAWGPLRNLDYSRNDPRGKRMNFNRVTTIHHVCSYSTQH